MEALKLLDEFEKTVKGIAKEYYRTFEWMSSFEEIRNAIKPDGFGMGSDKGGLLFSYEEINSLRQKYNDLCDIAPQTLNEDDHLIGSKLKAYCKRVEERGQGR